MKLCVLNDPDWGGFDPSFYLKDHQWSLVDIRKETVVETIRRISKEGFDAVLNFCDGAWEERRPGIEVVQALEHFEIPYTGADAAFYEPSRQAMKQVCQLWNIASPAGVFVSRLENLEREIDGLVFPLLVKHPNSYGSAGLIPTSRVEDLASLRPHVQRMIETFGGTLIEEFVDGREFSVLVSEDPNAPFCPKTYRPIEVMFPPGETFKHEHLKWHDYEKMQCIPVEDENLADRLEYMARCMFLGLNGSGYGRCDIRMNAQGVLFMLEINPNGAALYPPGEEGMADFILNHDPAGHAGFLDLLLSSALARHRRRKNGWQVRYRPGLGHGLFARRPFCSGDLILAAEESGRQIVTRKRLIENRSSGELERVYRYAYPFVDEMWSAPGTSAEDWKPINHSCCPNAWVDGLDLVARHPVAPGEEITVDYSTLFAGDMPTFRCACNSPACRGLIHGDDHLKPFVAEYGDHVTPYIKAMRARHGLTGTGLNPGRIP